MPDGAATGDMETGIGTTSRGESRDTGGDQMVRYTYRLR